MCCHVVFVLLCSTSSDLFVMTANMSSSPVIQQLPVHRLTAAGEEVGTAAEGASTFAETDP